MNMSRVHGQAKRLLTVHGDKAEAAAAQAAAMLAGEGKIEDAAYWRRVQAAISEMRGPHFG